MEGLNICGIKHNITEVIRKLKQNHPRANLKLVQSVYEYAKKCHIKQNRLSGEEYITHPIEVAYILAELELDASTIAAAILHDVIEDTCITNEEIIKNFGNEIAEMVIGVTKLRKNKIYNN